MKITVRVETHGTVVERTHNVSTGGDNPRHFARAARAYVPDVVAEVVDGLVGIHGDIDARTAGAPS